MPFSCARPTPSPKHAKRRAWQRSDVRGQMSEQGSARPCGRRFPSAL